jgi:hypothetical protein
MEMIMEPFWRSMSECKLLPLTTDFFPGEKELMTKTKYQNEPATPWFFKLPFIHTVDDYLNEYICLRLTQNFQLIKADPPTCHVDFQQFIFKKTDIKMSMGNKYNILNALDKEQFSLDTYTKMLEGTEEVHIRK